MKILENTDDLFLAEKYQFRVSRWRKGGYWVLWNSERSDGRLDKKKKWFFSRTTAEDFLKNGCKTVGRHYKTYQKIEQVQTFQNIFTVLTEKGCDNLNAFNFALQTTRDDVWALPETKVAIADYLCAVDNRKNGVTAGTKHIRQYGKVASKEHRDLWKLLKREKHMYKVNLGHNRPLN